MCGVGVDAGIIHSRSAPIASGGVMLVCIPNEQLRSFLHTKELSTKELGGIRIDVLPVSKDYISGLSLGFLRITGRLVTRERLFARLSHGVRSYTYDMM